MTHSISSIQTAGLIDPLEDEGVSKEDLLNELQVTINTLKGYCRLWGIDTRKRKFTPLEVERIKHAWQHVHRSQLNWSKERYTEAYLSQDVNCPSPQVTAYQEPVIDADLLTEEDPHETDSLVDEAFESGDLIHERYGEAIDQMGEVLADAVLEELDYSVIRHLSRKLKSGKGKGKGKPSTFQFLMKAAVTPKGRKINLLKLNPSQQVEQN